MYRICLLFRHLEGHLHARLLLLYQARAGLCMRWLDKISRMNYYSKGILFINWLMEVGNVPTVAVQLSGLSSASPRTDKHCMAVFMLTDNIPPHIHPEDNPTKN